MLSFSQTTGYAVFALAYMLKAKGKWMLGKDIAERTQIPLPYLSKIMNTLARAGVVRAKRGYRGGYELTRPADEIRLIDIVDAVEGPDWKSHCLFGARVCPGVKFCPVYQFWTTEKARLESEFLRLTLKDLARLATNSYRRLRPRTLAERDRSCACCVLLDSENSPTQSKGAAE